MKDRHFRLIDLDKKKYSDITITWESLVQPEILEDIIKNELFYAFEDMEKSSDTSQK